MVDEITSALLTGKWHRHTDGRYYPGAGGIRPYGYDWAELAQRFLRLVHEKCVAYFQARNAGLPNYEHLFDLVERVETECAGYSNDVSIQPFVEMLTRETSEIWRQIEDGSYEDDRQLLQVASLSEQSKLLIEGAVRCLLQPKGPPQGLEALVGLCKEPEVTRVDIVTLNHDLLVETALTAAGIEYRDGFSTRDGNIRYFDERPFRSKDRVTLLKPHGSLNWYRVLRRTTRGSETRYGMPDPGSDPWHLRGETGEILDVLVGGGDSLFLTGTQKSPKYLTGLHGMQISLFRRFLAETNQVVCCGYGWRDSGINQIIEEWMRASINHRLYLLHEKPSKDLFRQNFWLNRHEHWIKRRRVQVVQRWLCDLSTSDLLSVLRRGAA